MKGYIEGHEHTKGNKLDSFLANIKLCKAIGDALNTVGQPINFKNQIPCDCCDVRPALNCATAQQMKNVLTIEEPVVSECW